MILSLILSYHENVLTRKYTHVQSDKAIHRMNAVPSKYNSLQRPLERSQTIRNFGTVMVIDHAISCLLIFFSLYRQRRYLVKTLSPRVSIQISYQRSRHKTRSLALYLRPLHPRGNIHNQTTPTPSIYQGPGLHGCSMHQRCTILHY
jgi:hypothetical protein